MTLPADGYTVEVLLLPAVAEVGSTTGILISIRKAETERYYTGPVSLTVRPANKDDKDGPVALVAEKRPDLDGDREARHIFHSPGSYSITIEFRPEDKPLAAEVPVSVVISSGPSLLYLGLILAVFVAAVFIVGLFREQGTGRAE